MHSDIKKTRRWAEKREMWREIKAMNRDLRDREWESSARLVRTASVVCTTNAGAGARRLDGYSRMNAER